MYKIVIFIPESHLSQVKEAMFAAGAGKIGDYEACCWEVKGTGQFRPLAGSDPFIGKRGEVEQVVEYRVEMVLADEYVQPVIAALKQAHPYEEPAYQLWQVITE